MSNIFRKFVYLGAIQIILLSQFLGILSVLTAVPVYAESGSESDGQVVTENSGSNNSGSGSNQEQEQSDITATQSNSGKGSGGQQNQDTQSTSNSGPGNDAPAPEAPAEETVPPADPAPKETGGKTDEPTPLGAIDTTAEATPLTPVTTAADDAGGNQGAVQDAPGDTIRPGDTAAPADAPEAAPDAQATDVATNAESAANAIGSTDPAKGPADESNGFPVWYQDTTGTAVAPCLDGTDPNCVLPGAGEEPGFDPAQPTELGTNFPSEFFYWVSQSDSLDTPNGGKTFVRMALEGAFLNEEPVAGDQMVFGRVRVTGTGLEPNSTYSVIHPYGEDTFQTDERGIISRGGGTQDTGCFSSPCDFSLPFTNPVLESFLRWDTQAPAGYLGDAVTPHAVTGSPTGNNFFRITGPGLLGDGLLTDMFTVAGKLFTGELIADESTAPVQMPPAAPGAAAVGQTDPANGFPVSYQDANATAVTPCLDGTDPNCVLPGAGEEPGFNPAQPTELGTNFPSEFFYWIGESDHLNTPNGGKTFIRTALEGAFLNEDPVPGDQMVFGRIRVTGTGLEPNSTYTVTHPYGTDVYQTDDRGIIRRGEGTEDIGCFTAPCVFTEATQSRIFQSFLQWDSQAPAGYLGDAVTLHAVTGSPTGNNFFRITGPGLGEEGLFANLFTVAGKLFNAAAGTITDVITGVLPAEEPVAAEQPVAEIDIVEPLIDTDLPGDIIPDAPDTETMLPAQNAIQNNIINEVYGASDTETGSETETENETEEEEEEDNLLPEILLLTNILETIINTGNEPSGGQASNIITILEPGNVGIGSTSASNSADTSGNAIQENSSSTQTSTSTSDNNSSGGSSNSNSVATANTAETGQETDTAENSAALDSQNQTVLTKLTDAIPQEKGAVLGAEGTEPDESQTADAFQSKPKIVGNVWMVLAMTAAAIAAAVSIWLPVRFRNNSKI